MLVTVIMQTQPNGDVLAVAPDIPRCTRTDPDEGTAFARMRLAIEGAMADRLLDGQPIPDLRPSAAWKDDPRFAGARYYEVHMNLGHIQAVARHQRGRPRLDP